MKRWKWPLCVLLEDEVHEELAVTWWGRRHCSYKTIMQDLGVRRKTEFIARKGWFENINKWTILHNVKWIEDLAYSDNVVDTKQSISERYLRKRTTCRSIPLALMRHLCNVSTRWMISWHCVRTCRVRCRNQRLHICSWSLEAPSTSLLSYDHLEHSTMNTELSINAKTDVYLIFCIMFCVSFGVSNPVFPIRS